eukprot:jgi/Chrpa1/25754/Chrysochromulina_OHIO_Genome00013200-RA
MGLEVTGRDVNASAGDGMGILPSNMFDAPPKAEALDPRAIAIAQLSELLEWERKARVEAQNRVLELDAELHRVRLDAIAERERLKLELAAAEAANGDGNDAEIALQDATQRFHDELSALKKQLRELEREKAASAQAHGAASGELESHKRAAARAMAEAHELRRRTGQTARRAAVQLRGIKEQWTTCQLALTEQAIETRTIFDDARAAFAKAAACVIQREADEKRALLEQAAEAGKLAEALAAARAEAKRLGEELKSTAPALAEAQSALKRERANLKRLQELCDRLKDERADAAALEKARDEALANAFAAAVLEKKLRNELEGERAKTQAQAARVLAAESAAAEARAQSQRFEGQVMELTAAIEALQRQLNQRGPRVSGASLRQLEAAARELYISGGRHIEGFLSALAKLEVHHAYEDGESEEGSTKPSRKPSSDEVLGKKQLAGKRCRLTAGPSKEDLSKVSAAVSIDVENSFANAEAVQQACGWEVIKGYAVYELEDALGTFVAHKRWWNQKPTGVWVDVTPRVASATTELVLLESALGAKTPIKMSDAVREGAKARLAMGGFAIGVPPSDRLPPAPLPASSPVATKPKPKPPPTPPKLEFKGSESLEELVQLLTKGSSHAQVRAAAALAAQAATGPTESQRIVSAGGLQPLLLLLRREGEVQEHAARAIMSLADCMEHQKQITVAGAIPAVVQLLQGATPAVQDTAAGILGNLAIQNPANQAAIVAAGALPPLVNLLLKGSSPAKEQACFALWNLACQHPDNQLAIEQAAAIKP